MVDPYRKEVECQHPGCDEKYELQIDSKEDFIKDSVAGTIDAVSELVPLGKPDPQAAADKVEDRMQDHHSLNVGEDGKFYCDEHIDQHR